MDCMTVSDKTSRHVLGLGLLYYSVCFSHKKNTRRPTPRKIENTTVCRLCSKTTKAIE